MSQLEAVDYIFDHIEEFRAHYADVIERFESIGVEPKTAEAMAITMAAKIRAIMDL